MHEGLQLGSQLFSKYPCRCMLLTLKHMQATLWLSTFVWSLLTHEQCTMIYDYVMSAVSNSSR